MREAMIENQKHARAIYLRFLDEVIAAGMMPSPKLLQSFEFIAFVHERGSRRVITRFYNNGAIVAVMHDMNIPQKAETILLPAYLIKILREFLQWPVK